ncbi:magnesium chelatase [Streptomyces sp. NBC_00620]|uniref:magnesium chelatase n=1 Tax=Streptomyces sp. NBC_00620 TaxID=2903666 RepID=UPI002251A749|nr:magnesium chelatase [Streptomyces sp. NBC_00620]MCX4971459.1 magnesium chelatase [Streptomyces sp. NBC_00620]
MTTETPSPEPPDDARRLELAFRCAALDPGLGGVLLFDLEPRLVEPVSRLFAAILGSPADTPVPRIPLGAATRDEDLWSRSRLERYLDGVAFTVGPGPLLDSAGPPPLAVVPDLTTLSVAGMRAAVQLIGSDVVSVEQPGLRLAIRPQARWLAVCRSEDAGRVTPHLLDRFAVRLSVPGLHAVPDEWPPEAARPTVLAATTDEAVDRVQEILGPGAGPRRSLALARLARALAPLDGQPEVTARHCEEAARLIGLPVTDSAAVDDSADSEAPAPLPPPPLPRPHGSHRGGRREQRRTPGEEQPLLAPGDPVGVGPTPAVTLGMPYPEDEAAVLREFMPLRNPWQRRSGPASTRGPVVGTRRARDLRDLALVRTVREAAVHQRIRGNTRFTVAPVDLHSRLRAPAPERLLTLLLDHTCRGDWDWQDALTPFLQWAYTARAAAHVIEVGGADAADELRAESFAARGVLDPRVLAALYRPKGRATPLAHGIEQAAQVLRAAFRRQGSALAEAWLVVVTDGRGNVPLLASHTGRLHGPVATAGVEDSLTAAAPISAMDRSRLRVAVVDAARSPYGDLPFALAETLGATVVEGRVRDGG